MPNYLSDQSLCLRLTDFSETSQIASLFTAHHGLLPVIAKGSKRQSKSGAGSFSGPLDLLTTADIVFIPSKGAAELATLSAWQLTNHRSQLRQNLPALNAAMLAAEITLALLHPHDPHEELFHELAAALDLFTTPQRMCALVAYAKTALTEAGYQPHLDVCLNNACPITPDASVKFSFKAGGIFCETCPTQGPTLTVPGRLIIALNRLPTPRTLQSTPPRRAADPAALRTALELLLGHIESVLNRPIRTRSLLDAIFR